MDYKKHPTCSVRHISFEIKQLSGMIERDFDSTFCRNGSAVTKTQGRVIGFVHANRDRDIFQRDIENEFGTRRSTISVLLASMETGGLIRRESVDYDARLKKIVLTDEAKRQMEKIKSELDCHEATLIKGIAPEELSVFYTIIGKIKDNIAQNEERNDR